MIKSLCCGNGLLTGNRQKCVGVHFAYINNGRGRRRGFGSNDDKIWRACSIKRREVSLELHLVALWWSLIWMGRPTIYGQANVTRCKRFDYISAQYVPSTVVTAEAHWHFVSGSGWPSNILHVVGDGLQTTTPCVGKRFVCVDHFMIGDNFQGLLRITSDGKYDM